MSTVHVNVMTLSLVQRLVQRVLGPSNEEPAGGQVVLWAMWPSRSEKQTKTSLLTSLTTSLICYYKAVRWVTLRAMRPCRYLTIVYLCKILQVLFDITWLHDSNCPVATDNMVEQVPYNSESQGLYKTGIQGYMEFYFSNWLSLCKSDNI